MKSLILPIATLTGTIIGVGIFSLPFIAMKVGFFVMLIYFIVLGSVALLIHLLFGELSLKTPDFKRLPGFSRIYLGSFAEGIAFFSNILGGLGSILAYIIVGGEFLAVLFSGNILLFTLIYFTIGAIVILIGINIISKIEFWGTILLLAILLIIFSSAVPNINIDNLVSHFNIYYLFLPYGPILFSLWGASIIPEVEEMLRGDKKKINKVITISIIISTIAYIIFTFSILGITGANTTESALTGIQNILGQRVFILGLIFGILATFTSFISIGLTLKKVFWYDLGLNKRLSWALTCFIPLILYLLGVNSFILVISLIGAITLGIEGILILLMHRKIRKTFIFYPLVALFLVGIIFEIAKQII